MSHIRQSFNRAATTYDIAGTLQHQVAAQLTALITKTLPAGFQGRFLDAGCGTGFCLTELSTHYSAASCIALDFAERMLQQLPATLHAKGVNANLEHLPVASGAINVYLSSLAWQWCDMSLAAEEASRALAPQGEFFLATLVNGTFTELAQCLQVVHLNPDDHLLHYASTGQITAAAERAGLKILDTSTTRITTWHRDFKTLRHSIRGVGANHLPNQSTAPLNRHARQQLIDAYEVLRTDRGLPLSYEVLMLHGRKR